MPRCAFHMLQLFNATAAEDLIIKQDAKGVK